MHPQVSRCISRVAKTLVQWAHGFEHFQTSLCSHILHRPIESSATARLRRRSQVSRSIGRSTLYQLATLGEIESASLGLGRGRRVFVTASIVGWLQKRLAQTKRPNIAIRAHAISEAREMQMGGSRERPPQFTRRPRGTKQSDGRGAHFRVAGRERRVVDSNERSRLCPQARKAQRYAADCLRSCWWVSSHF